MACSRGESIYGGIRPRNYIFDVQNEGERKERCACRFPTTTGHPGVEIFCSKTFCHCDTQNITAHLFKLFNLDNLESKSQQFACFVPLLLPLILTNSALFGGNRFPAPLQVNLCHNRAASYLDDDAQISRGEIHKRQTNSL